MLFWRNKMWAYMKARFLLDMGFFVNYWWIYLIIILIGIGAVGLSAYFNDRKSRE
jgi:hypothetical protein